MLQIHYINPSGLFSYGYSEGVYFRDGKLVNLVGVDADNGGSSNGAGKSSLFNSLCELLFGSNPTDVNGPSIVNNIWGKGCCARTEFTSWEKIRYRVTLCRDWKETYYPADNDNQVAYKGTGLFLDKYENDIWKDCQGAGMPDTRKIILEKVGIPYSRFLSIAYMSHRVGNKFLLGTNKDRMEILSGITGVEEWDSIRDKCRAKKRGLQDESSSLGEKVSHTRGLLEGLQAQLTELCKTDWNEARRSYEKSLESSKRNELIYTAKLVEVKEKKELCIAESLYGQDTNEYLNKVNENRQKIVELQHTEVERRSNPELEEKLRQVGQDIEYTRGQLSTFRGKDGALLELTKCPTCDSNITKTKKATIEKNIRSLTDEIAAFEAERDRVTKLISDEAEKARSEWEDLKARNQQEIDKLVKKNDKLLLVHNENMKKQNAIRSELSFLESRIIELEKDLSTTQQNIQNIFQWIEMCDLNIRSIEDLGKKIEEANKSLNVLLDSAQEIYNRMEVVNWLISNIPFIKLHKLSTSMVTLSDYINSFLADMGDSIRVEIKAFSEKKSANAAGDFTDLLKGEVNVEIADGEKKINSRLYSDGELGRISNAFVRSLREMALKFGYGCNILMLDEIFSFIDYYNSQRLADSFVKSNAGTVIITDNSERAGNLIEFDEVWVARKNNNLTVLEVS